MVPWFTVLNQHDPGIKGHPLNVSIEIVERNRLVSHGTHFHHSNQAPAALGLL